MTKAWAWVEDGTAGEAIMAEYKTLREHVRDVVIGGMLKCLGAPEFRQAGKDLGVVRNGVFCFDNETAMSVVQDFALMFSRKHRTTPCERYCKLMASKPQDALSRAACAALASVRYTFLVLNAPRAGYGCEVYDVLSGSDVFLVDRNMSESTTPGLVLATAVMSFRDCVMTTGASLPLAIFDRKSRDSDIASLMEYLRDLDLPHVPPFLLSGPQQTKLARSTIRGLLERGASENMRFG